MVGWAPDGKHGRRKDSVTSVLLCFAGGVLLATCIVHMVPEVRRNFDNHQTNTSTHKEDDYASNGGVPMAEIVLCCGFFVIFLIEELVLTFAKEDTKE